MASDELREIKTILVATGLTHESVGAVLQAINLSEKLGAELHAVHAIEPMPSVEEKAMPGLAGTQLKQAEETLEKFAQSHGLQDGTHLHVVRGNPETEILRLRKTVGADLLVLGRYGKGGLKHGRLGSIATQLVRQCPVPALVVKPEFRGEFKRIGFASDLDDPETVEIARAAMLAKEFGVEEIVGINTFELPTGYHTMYTWEEACERIGEAHRKEFEKQYANACGDVGGVAVRYRIEHGGPVKVIPAIAAEEQLDLLVVGTHFRSRAARVLLGRVSERIMHEAGCSVWAEKSPKVYQGLLDAVKELME